MTRRAAITVLLAAAAAVFAASFAVGRATGGDEGPAARKVELPPGPRTPRLEPAGTLPGLRSEPRRPAEAVIGSEPGPAPSEPAPAPSAAAPSTAPSGGGGGGGGGRAPSGGGSGGGGGDTVVGGD